MTFSIVARDRRNEAWGVAVASRYLAVGAMVPAAAIGAGALATQASTNMSFRESGLAMLRAGLGAPEVLTALLDADEGRESRQVGIVDHKGGAMTWTGSRCQPFAGGRAGADYAVQGNLLHGPEVIEKMVETWSRGAVELPLAHRLLATLASGDDAGGDRRGRQSAALLVVRRGGAPVHHSDVEVDLRVDDAAHPIDELRRLLALHDQLRATS